MNIVFREVDPFNCWIWIRFSESPTQDEKNYLDGVFDSWYVLGRLGGFNSENLQTHEEGSDLSWMSYDNDQKNSSLPALCLLYTSPSPRDLSTSRMPSSA